ALAMGAKTYKLKFGHHALNHPVKNLKTGRVEITSQNHGFAVDPNTLPKEVEVSHINLNDRSVEGIICESKSILAVQYHPEASPGPHDSRYLFDEFVEMINKF
ncbi:MAG: glutamine amidotransferase-related protein, partial [Brevinematia bacterium]